MWNIPPDAEVALEQPLAGFVGSDLTAGLVHCRLLQRPPRLSDPVNTCSISFGDPAFNESHFASMVAERYRTDHRVGEVSPDDFELIDKLGALYDEPYADSSAMPTYRVCELARKQVTVALSGFLVK